MKASEIRRLAKSKRLGEWVQGARIGELEDLVSAAKDAYYNSSSPIMADSAFDLVFSALKSRKPNSPALTTGAKARSKVALPVGMGSLDKAKDAGDLGRWSARQGADRYVVMDKLDGVSFLIHSPADGSPSRMFTRGDGRHGQDISAWLDAIDVPPVAAGTAVRGELIMSEARFTKTWAKHAANARNLVSGLVNRKALSDRLRDVHAVAYEIIGRKMSPEAQLRKLKSGGWRIPAYRVTTDLDAERLAGELAKRKAKSPYRLDGLVIAVNEPRPRPRSGNPQHMVAFKRNLESDAVVADVTDVVWRATRHGKLRPRVRIKPVQLSGVKVEFISGHNAAYIRRESIGPGARVKVIRSGDVIPYIMEVVKAAKPKLPTVPFEWDGVDAVVPEGTGSDEARMRATEFFFSSLGIEGIKYGTVSKLAGAGYGTLVEIVRMPEVEMVDALGKAGGLRLSKALDSLYESGVRLDAFMAASGVFPGVGRTRFAQLVDSVPEIMDLRPRELHQAMIGLPGWGSSLAASVSRAMPEFRRLAKELELDWRTDAPAGSMSGEVVLFTGFRDKGLAKDIEGAGGRVAGNFSAKVTVLVTKDGTSSSAKAKAAKRSGVPIMGPDELRERFGI